MVEVTRSTTSFVGRPRVDLGMLGEVRFMCEPMSIVDLLALLPFWFGWMVSGHNWASQLFRSLRLLRILRMLRLAQESSELLVFCSCVLQALPALRLLGFFLLLELIIVGGLVFHAERGNGDQLPENGVWLRADRQPAEFQSIPDAAWWALVTITTVGYGDSIPQTGFGKLIAGVAMLTGLVGISAIVSIIQLELQHTRMEKTGGGGAGAGAVSIFAHADQAGARVGRGTGLVSSSSCAFPPPLSSLSGGSAAGLGAADAEAHAAGHALGQIEQRVDELRGLLADARRRACAQRPVTNRDGSDDGAAAVADCLQALEESAISALTTFVKVGKRSALEARVCWFRRLRRLTHSRRRCATHRRAMSSEVAEAAVAPLVVSPLRSDGAT